MAPYRIVAHRFSASARDSGRQTSLYIEICMRIDELKPNRICRDQNLGLWYLQSPVGKEKVSERTVDFF